MQYFLAIFFGFLRISFIYRNPSVTYERGSVNEKIVDRKAYVTYVPTLHEH